MLVLDAFSSDAIPVHLMTREAFAVYKRVLNEHGLLLVHISNQQTRPGAGGWSVGERRGTFRLDTESRRPGLKSRTRRSNTGPTGWSFVKHREDFGPLATDTRWRKPIESELDEIWTDDYSNLLSVIKW